MRDETKPFLGILCVVSTTMASLCFVGVSIILTIFYKTENTAWKAMAYYGTISVFLFAAASIFALVLLYPVLKISKKGKRQTLKITIAMFAAGWIFFFILISTLIRAFAV